MLRVRGIQDEDRSMNAMSGTSWEPSRTSDTGLETETGRRHVILVSGRSQRSARCEEAPATSGSCRDISRYGNEVAGDGKKARNVRKEMPCVLERYGAYHPPPH